MKFYTTLSFAPISAKFFLEPEEIEVFNVVEVE